MKVPVTLSRLPLRVRLVAGFSAVMLVVLTTAGAVVFWRVAYALDRGLDESLTQAASAIAPLVAADGTVSDLRSADATGTGWQTLTPDGAVVSHGGPAGAAALVGADALGRVPASPASLTVDLGSLLRAGGEPFRLRLSEVAGGDRATYLLVALPRDRRDEALRELLLQLVLAGLGALVLTALVGDRLAWFALLPVERYRRQAAEIAGGAVRMRLDVPAQRDDEVTRLGTTLNDMLGALERALERERRFVDEASHELRTPLTLLTTRIQLARHRQRSSADYESTLDELAVDVSRLTTLAENLLAVGAADGTAQGEADATPTIRALVDRWRGAHPVDVAYLAPDEPIVVPLSPSALEGVIANLLDNAAKYGAPPIRVDLRVASGQGGTELLRLTVADAGSGMPPDLLDRAADRFTRAAESRATSGAGLGLSLVAAVTLSVGGELRICHAGKHTSRGNGTGIPCEHDDQMTVTVLFARSSRGPAASA